MNRLFYFCWALFISLFQLSDAKPVDTVTIAILAKDKAHTLPLYLSCLEKQTWPKNKTHLYIRTNNNNDNTVQVLKDWLEKVGPSYANVYFDTSDLPEQVQQYGQHEWNSVRFKVLGKIRQSSVEWAQKHNSHYFVVDCDNFIQPQTLERLVQTDLPIVAPLLTTARSYSNYHAAVDSNGYYADSPSYFPILHREIRGLIQMPVVHCTYFIQHSVLSQIVYDDDSYRYEYVIFSDNARKKNIPQYLDNREVYGRITFAENKEELEKEPWLYEFANSPDQLQAAFTHVYDNGVWARNSQGKGSSGDGSTAHNTACYRQFLTDFLKNHQILSVVDAGCGDWEFSHLIDWQGIHYKGYDIVKSVIEANSQLYSTPSIQFIHADFSKSDLPPADLLICKDVLQHLSNPVILEIIPQLKKFKYCLLVNDTAAQSENDIDINVLGYRRLDLSKPPFNLQGEKIYSFDCGRVKKEVFLIKNFAEPAIPLAQKVKEGS